ncbi:MAG: hypothetical protein L0H19_01895 [Salinisphaera sp.]|nr:hypothetical protein [Salinisphaera sp.]
MSEPQKKSWMGRLVLPLLGFGVICLITAFFLSFIASDQLLLDKVPATGGVVGPFTIKEDGTVLVAEVSQSLPLQTWSFVSLALLDQKKQWLIGFGNEFWHEAGYDGGRWEQAVSSYEATLTIPKDGQYYMQVKPENNMRPAAAAGNEITVRLTTRGFSTIPHFAAGMIAIIAGLILSFVSGGKVFSALKET